MPPFTLVQLRYFAAAVECGSMTAASRELMVSQSAVSTAIAQLEKALGVTLVLRHHAHGLALTGAGRAFHNARLPSRTATTSKRTWFARTSARPRPMSCSPGTTGSPGVRLSRCATWRTTR